MKPKIFTLFTALTLSAGALFASDTAVGGIYYKFDDVNLTATVTYRGSYFYEYDEYTGDVVIPATVTYGGNTYSVTSIGEAAFYKCSGLTSVTIPNSVTSIGWDAFQDCSILTSVTIPNSVTSIGMDAFKGTAWLENQPDGVIYINQSLYIYKGEMPANTSIVVRDGTIQICGSAFSGCSGLTSVTIPNSVTSIGSYAFYYCDGLTSVTIPNSVTSIGDFAFYGCSGLTSVTIPNSVTSIGIFAFSECSGLTSVTIGNSVTSIGDWAFWGCRGLTSVTIGNSVTSIGDWAFKGCSGLTSVTIGNSVTSIGEEAFHGCTALRDITALPTVPPTCGRDAFYNVPIGATLRCPCESREAYQATATWIRFTNIIPADFPNVTLLADKEQGSVQVEDRICESKSVVISATANAGYHFVQWSNGATDATYTFILTQDTILTAEFALNQHKVTVTAGENGSVKVVLNDEETAETTFAYGTEIIITATADEGYCFLQWDDDNIDNPRTITVVEDITLSAEFAPSQTALETVTLSPVYAVDGRIVCEGEFRIYDLLGRDVTRLNGSLCGVYVVKTANAAVKVVVK